MGSNATISMMEVPKYKISPYVANQYASLFKSLNSKFDKLYEHLNDDFLITTNKVKRYNGVAREKLNSEKLSDSLRTKIKSAMRSFDTIVIELQYHDIIRQKLEHICTFERQLSCEFDRVYEHKASNFKANYLLVTYDLVRLAQNQLQRVRTEYLQASNKVQRLLRMLWADREISQVLQLFLFNTAENMRSVLGTLDRIIKVHEGVLDSNGEFKVDINDEERMRILQKVKDSYTMDSEREVFNETFGIEEEFVSEDDILF